VGPEGKAQKDHRHWQDALLEGRFQRFKNGFRWVPVFLPDVGDVDDDGAVDKEFKK
jgi:hypothetical protein